jgi:hypothetical protein
LAIMNSIASLVARDTNTVRTFEIRGFAGTISLVGQILTIVF